MAVVVAAINTHEKISLKKHNVENGDIQSTLKLLLNAVKTIKAEIAEVKATVKTHEENIEEI